MMGMFAIFSGIIISSVDPCGRSILEIRNSLMEDHGSLDRYKARDDLWTRYEKWQELALIEPELEEEILETLVLTYAQNQFSDPFKGDQILENLDRIAIEDPNSVNDELLDAIELELRDYLFVSPKSIAEALSKLGRLSAEFSGSETGFGNRIESIKRHFLRHKIVSLTSARMLGAEERVERRILLGSRSPLDRGGIPIGVDNLETRRSRAFVMLAYHSTFPRTARLYADALLKVANRYIVHSPLLVIPTVSVVIRDIQQALQSKDLKASERASLLLALRRIQGYFSEPN